ncbi:hypothetical protein TIFTF001_046812 [Ficus carica]|uniref:Uncharacterized protein n=1 Tax=Ficus carica TaxID=3494 RepID=A0AA87ZCJ1_FICCA|nr:hypothetical protein TIFTF001_046812 [Ficus carica]
MSPFMCQRPQAVPDPVLCVLSCIREPVCSSELQCATYAISSAHQPTLATCPVGPARAAAR